MEFVYSNHWKRKKKYRKGITDDFIKYAIQHAKISKDKYWEDAYNAILRIPQMGRLLKVVYKRVGKNQMKIITAFWLD